MKGNKYHVQFFDPHILLVINTNGKIRQLHTPIKVQCIEDVGMYKKGVYVYVDEIAKGFCDELIYHIGEAAYYHKHFRLVANF